MNLVANEEKDESICKMVANLFITFAKLLEASVQPMTDPATDDLIGGNWIRNGMRISFMNF